MLKHIELTELELGMFVHKMEGSWFDHPFWKAKFLLSDTDKLEILKASELEGVVIDTTKGKDTADERPSEQSAGQPSSASNSGAKARIGAIKSRRSVEQAPPKPVSIEKEKRAAQAVADRAQERMNKTFLAARLGKALNARAVEPVVNDIMASVRRNPQAFGGLMRCKLRNEFTYRHSLAVSALMVSLARQMKLSETAMREAGLAGLFLDIGTNYLPQDIEPANGDYRNAGPAIWEQHVKLGHRALQNDDTLPNSVLDACLMHHERIDGGGFPQGLAGNDIGQFARMAAICDTFDFMLTETENNSALDPASAIKKLEEMDGAFDKEILRKFIESVGLYPVGSFVKLRSGMLAMVIDEDKLDIEKPVVQAFYSIEQAEEIKPQKIELARIGGEDEIVAIADLSDYELPDADYLRDMIFLRSH